MQQIEAFENIPPELTSLAQWVVHRSKIPFDPKNGNAAKAARPETWSDFGGARHALGSGRYDGIGFQFNSNGLVGIDLDTVRDPESGTVDPNALEIINKIGSYTEISPSGYGFHIICRADVVLSWNKVSLPANGINRVAIDAKTGQPRINKKTGQPELKKPELEIYNNARYFTVTGHVFENFNRINSRDREVNELISLHSKDGAPKDYLKIGLERDQRFRSLWYGMRPCGNESADDMGLMAKLAYYCDCDVSAMLSAFKSSPYFAQKDERHLKKADRADYLPRTAKKAAAGCAETARERDRTYKKLSPRTAIKKAARYMQVFEPLDADPELLNYELNDAGNARRLLHYYGEVIRWNSELAAWYIWNGSKWEHDYNKIFRLAIKVAMTYKHTADSLSAGDIRLKAAKRHALASGMLPKIYAMVESASHAVAIKQAELDCHKNLISCKNGIVRLDTGELITNNHDYYMTRMVHESYNAAAETPVFTAFLHKIFDGDDQLISYVQRVMGYCMTGETREQCFFIGYGTGANGKSTLIETVSGVLREFTQTIPTNLLMDQPREGASPELARAKGARLIVASESKDMNTFNEAQIKQLTGGDMIAARPLYSQGFQYVPNFKVWLSTNYKPHIRSADIGIWRRVQLIPFTVTIPEHEQDKTLPEKLRRESGGIFKWLIDGARMYYENGLNKPDAVRKATDDYKAEMDTTGAFLSECVEACPGSFLRSTVIYGAYLNWCAAGGMDGVKQNLFSRRLTERGIIARRTENARGYQDFRLTSAGESFYKISNFLP